MDVPLLQSLCKQIRYYILTSTTQTGSGHPTSSLSAVELMTTLFFGGYFRYDINHPYSYLNDRVIFSKGHASPLLYALWTAAGAISKEEMLTLRQFGSRLEGHPTPALPFIDVATGSLGQGLSVGVGMSLAIKLHTPLIPSREGKRRGVLETLPRVFVLLGDSELAEGQNWEALSSASYYKLNNLVGILDVNRLGQRGETMLGWDIKTYQKRIESFGWKTIIIEDGHDIKQVIFAFNRQSHFVPTHQDYVGDEQKPTMIIARTIKGKGVSFLENADNWHGKAVPKERLQEALTELGKIDWNIKSIIQKPDDKLSLRGYRLAEDEAISSGLPRFARNDKMPNCQLLTTNYSLPTATREAYGDALVTLGKQDKRIVVLDAETSNSTFTEKFKKEFPNRFFEMFIAEQNMVSAALGFSKMGFVPFVSTFAAFFTRAFDQIRMAQYSVKISPLRGQLKSVKTSSKTNKLISTDFNRFQPISALNIVGSHAGCSIGSDGASQMALEDIAMMRSIRESTILYPSDAVSTTKLTSILVNNPGISYLRLTREKTPIIYNEREEFKIGGCKVHYANRETRNAKRLTLQNKLKKTLPASPTGGHVTRYTLHALIIAAGITLHEALKAQKILAEKKIYVIVVDLYSIKPLDKKTILQLAQQTNHIIVVEDHYPAGGIGEAVLTALTNNQQLTTNYRFTHLCVRKLPHSGTPEELLRYEEIDAEAIIKTVALNRLPSPL